MEKYYVVYDICVSCGKPTTEGEMLCPMCQKLKECDASVKEEKAKEKHRQKFMLFGRKEL